MACSDNTIRAGLTPKFRDINTLCSSLTYKNKTIQEVMLPIKKIDKFTSFYGGSADEFAVEFVDVDATEELYVDYVLPPKSSGSILLVMHGNGTAGGVNMNPGFIFFNPAVTSVVITANRSRLQFYRAFVQS